MCRLHQQPAASSLCSNRKMHWMNRDFQEVHIMSTISDHYVYFSWAGFLPECGDAAGTNDVTSLDLPEKRSDTLNRASVYGSKSKHGSTQLETSKTLFQSLNETQEDSTAGLGIDHTDDRDVDKQNLKRRKLWCFISYTIIPKIFKLKYYFLFSVTSSDYFKWRISSLSSCVSMKVQPRT